MMIDRKYPNLIHDHEDIGIYSRKIQEHRLFLLLAALDDKFEMVKRKILKRKLLQPMDAAYAAI